MTERNELSNGRFTHDLNGWTVSGAEYSAGDGDDHYGVAVLETGEYIEQDFAVERIRAHTFHIDIKPTGSDLSGSEAQVVVEDGDGNVVFSRDLSGTADTWTENEWEAGLASGTNYTVRVINNSFGASVKIDDIWIWDIPISRSELATRIHAKLGRLATERSLSTSASGAKTEGDYTCPIDDALRDLGAINPETGDPDARYVEPEEVSTLLDLVRTEALEFLKAEYSVEVDIGVGPRKESRSQIASSIDDIIGGKDGGGGPGRVVERKLKRD